MEDEADWEDVWDEVDDGEEYVMGYREGQERDARGGRIMGTMIEGEGKLARLQELQLKKDPAARHEAKFIQAYLNIKDATGYNFGSDAEETLKIQYMKLEHSLYKDPALFLFANIALYGQNGKITKKGLDEARRASLKTEYSFLTEDLVRYCRLING